VEVCSSFGQVLVFFKRVVEELTVKLHVSVVILAS